MEDLNAKIVEGCNRIRELKETIRLLDSDLVGSARRVQEVNVRRENMVALRKKLMLIQYVNQALSTLKLVSIVYFISSSEIVSGFGFGFASYSF